MSEIATTLHGTAIAVEERGLLILGAPGSGKSTLAIELIALGAVLVADDSVAIRHHGEGLLLAVPQRNRGLIEARGVGILRMAFRDTAPLHLIADLDAETGHRLPSRCHRSLLGRDVPVILGKGRQGLASILMALLSGADLIDPDAPLTA